MQSSSGTQLTLAVLFACLLYHFNLPTATADSLPNTTITSTSTSTTTITSTVAFATGTPTITTTISGIRRLTWVLSTLVNSDSLLKAVVSPSSLWVPPIVTLSTAPLPTTAGSASTLPSGPSASAAAPSRSIVTTTSLVAAAVSDVNAFGMPSELKPQATDLSSTTPAPTTLASEGSSQTQSNSSAATSASTSTAPKMRALPTSLMAMMHSPLGPVVAHMFGLSILLAALVYDT